MCQPLRWLHLLLLPPSSSPHAHRSKPCWALPAAVTQAITSPLSDEVPFTANPFICALGHSRRPKHFPPLLEQTPNNSKAWSPRDALTSSWTTHPLPHWLSRSALAPVFPNTPELLPGPSGDACLPCPGLWEGPLPPSCFNINGFVPSFPLRGRALTTQCKITHPPLTHHPVHLLHSI